MDWRVIENTQFPTIKEDEPLITWIGGYLFGKCCVTNLFLIHIIWEETPKSISYGRLEEAM